MLDGDFIASVVWLGDRLAVDAGSTWVCGGAVMVVLSALMSYGYWLEVLRVVFVPLVYGLVPLGLVGMAIRWMRRYWRG